MISETKIDNSFSIFQFTMKGCSIPFRLDWISYGGKIPLFVTENISCKIIKTAYNADFRDFCGVKFKKEKMDTFLFLQSA